MSTRSERDKHKSTQEKHQAILSQLLKDEDNKYCVDCDAKGPRWASWNLGIFLCIRCAGIHRNLGVHISKVKSVNLDTWTSEQIAMMQEMGNSRARAVYEAHIPDHFRRPQTDSALENFIRQKYETKKYIAEEWVPPKPKFVEHQAEEVACSSRPQYDEQKERKKSRPRPTSSANVQAPKSVEVKSPEEPAKPVAVAATAAAPAVDLLGLDMDQPPLVNNSAPQPQINGNAGGVPESTSNGDIFGDFFQAQGAPAAVASPVTSQDSSATPAATSGAGNGVTSDQSLIKEEAPAKNTKDSIMALFGNSMSQAAPPPQQQQQQQQQMPQFNMQGNMYNMNQPAQMQQMPPQMMQQNMAVRPGMMGMGGNNMAYMQPQGQMQGQMPHMQGMNQMQQRMPQQQQTMGMVQGQMGQGQMPQGQMNQGQMGQSQMGAQAQMMGQAGMMGYNMYGVQQAQFNQMSQQMAGMNLGMMGANAPSNNWKPEMGQGQTLSTNLWQ